MPGAMRLLVPASLLLLGSSASASAPLSLELTVDTPWVLSSQTHTEQGGLTPALHLALRDLRKDWYAVFGIQPLVLGTYFPYTDFISQGPKRELPPPYPVPSTDTIGTLVFLGGMDILADTLPTAALAKVSAALGVAPESHGCFALPPQYGVHAYTALVCTGVDELGVVYATYELSHLLGVDPQGHWTEHHPPPCTTKTIAVPAQLPDGPLLRIGGGAMSPAVEYRGFFVNDEDMLSGFAEDPLGESVFSIVSKNDEFCIQNEKLCIKNEELCIENEGLCIQNGDFCRRCGTVYSS